MINIKSKKGITLITLVITVIVLLILSGTVIYNSKSTNDVGKYNNMVADIELLNDKILVYYNKYGEVPVTKRVWERNVEGVGNVKYYEVDLAKLENLTLHYGKDYGKTEELTEESDVYLVNSNLHVYYLKGVESKGETYHFVDNSIKYAQDIEDEQTGLPQGLVELEYIENTGTQCIDTGVIPTVNTSTDIVYKSLDYQGSQYILGARNGGSGKIEYAFNGSKSSTNWDIRFNGVTYAGNKVSRNDHKYHSRVFMGNSGTTWSLIDLDELTTNTIEISNIAVSATTNLFLFAYNNSNIHDNLRVYSCKIYDEETLVRDFIPCKDSNNVVCLYDKVEGKYYYNQGTGEFVAGPEV